MLYVVTGPPTAGKSSWIEARAKPTDIVIDLDRIALALAGPGAPSWQHDAVPPWRPVAPRLVCGFESRITSCHACGLTVRETCVTHTR